MALTEKQIQELNIAQQRVDANIGTPEGLITDKANLAFAAKQFGFSVSNEEVIEKLTLAKGSPPASEAEIEITRNILIKRQVDQLSPAEQQRFLALNPQLSQAKEQIQATSNPSLFTGFLKAALAQKVKPEEQKIGRASIFEKRGLTGIASLSQALNTRNSQITDNIKNFTAFFNTASNVIRDQAQFALTNYSILRDEQQDLIDRQRQLEDQETSFNNQLRLLQKREELDRETDRLQRTFINKGGIGTGEIGEKGFIFQPTRNEIEILNAFNMQTASSELQNIFINVLTKSERKEFNEAFKREEQEKGQSLIPSFFFEKWLNNIIREEQAGGMEEEELTDEEFFKLLKR